MKDRALEFSPGNARIGATATECRAFERFLRDHYDMLLRFLRGRTASEHDAEDAVQESFVRLLRYRDAQAPEAWKPLMFRIAVNVAHDQSRQRLSRQRHDHMSVDSELLETLAVDIRSPERKLTAERELALVLQTIQRLPEKCRNIFLLSRFRGMSNREIAVRCGISVRMVEKQVTKALAACRHAVRHYNP